MSKIIFLGTSDAVGSSERDNTSLLVIDDTEKKILIDCPGAIASKLSKVNIDFRHIDKIIITHLHPDHIYGLPSLIHSQYKLNNKITIYGSFETNEFLKELILLFDLTDKTKFPVISYRSISGLKRETFYTTKDTAISCFPVKHKQESIGIKIKFVNSNITVVYTGDTAPSELTLQEAHNVDYLIHDCLCPSRFFEQYKSLETAHTSSLSLGELAQKAKVKNLVPIHFAQEVEYSMEEIVTEIRKNYTGNIIIPNDLDILAL